MDCLMSRDLSESELWRIDTKIDANFYETPMPAEDLYAARWALCSVGENTHWLAVHQAAKQVSGPEAVAALNTLDTQVDHYKYELRYALDLCGKRLPQVEKNGIHKVGTD